MGGWRRRRRHVQRDASVNARSDRKIQCVVKGGQSSAVNAHELCGNVPRRPCGWEWQCAGQCVCCRCGGWGSVKSVTVQLAGAPRLLRASPGG